MRDAWAKFERDDVALFAISYDDQVVLREFAEKQAIPFPLLSDVDSEAIRAWGVLNDQIQPGDAFLYGMAYPGAFVIDAEGRVVGKFFHDSYKKRDSPELYLDVARGRVEIAPDAPIAQVDDETDGIAIEVALHGGEGTLRQGMRREIVVRFRLPDGLHVYGEPVPTGMVPVSIHVEGPEGLAVEEEIRPPTRPLAVATTGTELPVWEGEVDFRIPVYATGALASEVRPLESDTARIAVRIRYQACDADICHLPRNEEVVLDVPLDVVDVPRLSMHTGHGQREGNFDGKPHLLRLARRKIPAHPLGFLRFIARSIRLEWAAWRRRQARK